VSELERQILDGLADQATRPLKWAPDVLGFWALVTHPCPFYDGMKRRCRVYYNRPYNCRRFGCFRPDSANEPFRDGQCFWTRFYGSRHVRKQALAMQTQAQRWARMRGWKASDV
jgi:Fe-S-cluster containining protein